MALLRKGETSFCEKIRCKKARFAPGVLLRLPQGFRKAFRKATTQRESASNGAQTVKLKDGSWSDGIREWGFACGKTVLRMENDVEKTVKDGKSCQDATHRKIKF